MGIVFTIARTVLLLNGQSERQTLARSLDQVYSAFWKRGADTPSRGELELRFRSFRGCFVPAERAAS